MMPCIFDSFLNYVVNLCFQSKFEESRLNSYIIIIIIIVVLKMILLSILNTLHN